MDAYLRVGRCADANRTAHDYAATATAKGRPWARAARALGLTGPDDLLDERFGTALAAQKQTPDAFEAARTQHAYGARLRRARRRVDARAQLRAAVTAFDDLGAAGWADVVAAELKATGETARPPGGCR